MPGPVKTEGVVLRSIRFGEADRILHLYTPQRGRVGAIAKGVRRTRSRFGGRLEPFFRAARSCSTRAAASSHGDRRRDDRRAPAAARATPARSTRRRGPATRSAACSTPTSRTPRSTTCCATSWPCSTREPARGDAHEPARVPPQAAARRRASRRSSAACARCGEREHLDGFSGAAGGVVCARLRGGLVPARRPRRTSSSSTRSARRSPRRPTAGERALAPGRARDRRDRRAPRRRPAAAPRPPGRIARRGTDGARSGSTSSPKARATCASCSAARAPTSPR